MQYLISRRFRSHDIDPGPGLILPPRRGCCGCRGPTADIVLYITPAELRNVTGRDLLGVKVLRCGVQFSSLFKTSAWPQRKLSTPDPTPFHKLLGRMRFDEKLVRCYTQNIDGMGLPGLTMGRSHHIPGFATRKCGDSSLGDLQSGWQELDPGPSTSRTSPRRPSPSLSCTSSLPEKR